METKWGSSNYLLTKTKCVEQFVNVIEGWLTILKINLTNRLYRIARTFNPVKNVWWTLFTLLKNKTWAWRILQLTVSPAEDFRLTTKSSSNSLVTGQSSKLLKKIKKKEVLSENVNTLYRPTNTVQKIYQFIKDNFFENIMRNLILIILI